MNIKGPVIVMELPEKLSGAEGRNFLRDLKPLLQEDRPRMVLDCSQVQHMDSAGIEILMQCVDETMKRDGDLKLAALSPASAAILELMRVDRLFEVFATTEEAARSFHTVTLPEGSASQPWYGTAFSLSDLKTAS